MSKTVYITDNNIAILKEHFGNIEGKDCYSPSLNSVSLIKDDVDSDEYELGDDGGGLSAYYHVKDSDKLNEWVQYNFDKDRVDRITYSVTVDDDEDGDLEEYEGEVYDTDGRSISYFSGDIADMHDIFGDKIAEMIAAHEGDYHGGEYHITDIAYMGTSNVDLNNPQEVSNAVKKISKSDGDSYYILTDGTVVGFWDHIEIKAIDGLTISKFLEMGNIRCRHNSVETMKKPTSEQAMVLKGIIRDADQVYVDFSKPNSNGGMYPENVFSVKYLNPNPNRIVNDIINYYSNGVRPLGESKKVNGNLITENTFESWFRNSVLVDAEGNPIKMYHGTDKEFNAFNKDFIGSTGSFEGYGFNFTPFYGRAASYNSKNVIEAYLRAERPMTTKSNKITLNMVMKIISELDKGKPYTDTVVAAYEPPKYNEKWDASYYRRALPVASKVILEYNKENGYGDAGVYAEICLNGNADIKKTIEVFESLGYDSAIFYDNDGRINTVIVFEPNQIKLTKNTTYNDDSEVMSENIEMELDASDVKLDSFKINKSLAPKIWDGLDLNPRVRLRLLDIADDFWETVGITWVRPCGIKLTGSICNYNWSKFSDIDLHLIVDFSKVDDRIDFVCEYFDGKKNEWNNEHEHLKLYGFPVELYVEDIHDETSSDGQYDLEENKWITKPSESFKPIGLDKYYIKNIVSKYATKIEDLKDELETTDDSHKLEVLGKKADALWKKIKAMRKYGLQRSGESDPFNIAYKCYRRMGYLDMLFDIKSQQYDKVNSIGINESIDDNIFSKLKAHYGTTYDIRECGYVLPDGSMLDFSGKHEVDDIRDKELLRGRRTTDHRDVTSIGVSMSDVIKSGAMRIDCNAGYANLYVRPTREQVDVLNRFVRRNDGCVTIEIGDGDESLSYCEYEDVRPMKVINAILRYFDDGIRLESDIREDEKKTVTITEEQADKIKDVLTESQESKTISTAKNESAIIDKSLIREYLEKDHNMPLYKYFKWVKESSQCERAEDLAYHCSNYIAKYIKRIRNRFPEFGKLVNINDEFDFEDDEQIEKFCALLKEYDLCGNFIAIMQDIVNGYGWYTDLPTWCTTDFIRLVKNEWCIHFTSDADNIAKYGLTGGTDDIDHLAYTNAGQEKHQEGYNFAFLIDDRDVDTNEYGNEAVIFRTSGVEIYHYGDMEHQVIFWGPNVKSFIPIKFDGNEGDWVVYGQNGQILKSGDPSDIAEWATENLPQYRKQIMTGKNGYIPQQTIYDPKTYKVSHKPYPLYQNESIQKYLTLLKEEVVADGNADNNVYAKKWKNERETLKRFILQNGTLMTSKENGKTYKVYFDQSLSNLIGINYCICLQYDQYTMDTGNTVYVRALDKFTSRMFRPHFDSRGLDNMSGTNDDNIGNY